MQRQEAIGTGERTGSSALSSVSSQFSKLQQTQHVISYHCYTVDTCNIRVHTALKA